jgi:tetratricopeptide (TPR) repeat protein
MEAALDGARFEIVDALSEVWWVTTAALCGRAGAGEVLASYHKIEGDEAACEAVGAVAEQWLMAGNTGACVLAAELARSGPGTRYKVLALRVSAALTRRVDHELAEAMAPRAVERAVAWLSGRGDVAGVAAIREALSDPEGWVQAAQTWLELREYGRACAVAERAVGVERCAGRAAELAGRAELEIGRIASAVAWVEKAEGAGRARLEARIWPEKERWENAAELSAQDGTSRGEDVAEAAWRAWGLGAEPASVQRWVREAVQRGVQDPSRVVLAEVLSETGDEQGAAEVLCEATSSVVRMQGAALLVHLGHRREAIEVLESVGRSTRSAREKLTAAETLRNLGEAPVGLCAETVEAGVGNPAEHEYVLAAAGLLYELIGESGLGGSSEARALLHAARIGVTWKAAGTLAWLERAYELGESDAVAVLGVLRGDMWMGGWAALSLGRCSERDGRYVEAVQWRLEALRRGKDVGDEALERAAGAALGETAGVRR